MKISLFNIATSIRKKYYNFHRSWILNSYANNLFNQVISSHYYVININYEKVSLPFCCLMNTLWSVNIVLLVTRGDHCLVESVKLSSKEWIQSLQGFSLRTFPWLCSISNSGRISTYTSSSKYPWKIAFFRSNYCKWQSRLAGHDKRILTVFIVAIRANISWYPLHKSDNSTPYPLQKNSNSVYFKLGKMSLDIHSISLIIPLHIPSKKSLNLSIKPLDLCFTVITYLQPTN